MQHEKSLVSILSYPFDADKIFLKKKKLKRVLLESNQEWVDKRVAVLGGCTTHDIIEVLDLFLLSHGIRCEYYESEFAQYWQDAMFPNPKLEAFAPDIIYLCTSNRNILRYPRLDDTDETVDALFEAEVDRYMKMWDCLSATYGCPIIQNNFELPFYRLLGNSSSTNIHGRVHFISRLNMSFAQYAQKHDNFYIVDINWISADYGLQKWSNPYYWHMYKYALSLDAIPTLCHNVANIIKKFIPFAVLKAQIVMKTGRIPDWCVTLDLKGRQLQSTVGGVADCLLGLKPALKTV